jgi:hypothetical protein
VRLIIRLWRWLVKRMPEDRLWQRLDRTGITVFVGPNGSGKSLAAVASRLPVLRGQTWECFNATHSHHEPYRRHLLTCDACPAAGVVQREMTKAEKDPVKTGAVFCVEGLWLLDDCGHGERLVYSTVVILGDDGEDHERYRPLVDYRQLVTIEHADVLFDEVAGVSDAGDSGSIPVQVVQWLHTLRKADVRLVVTTPAYARCSKPIRQVAQVVVDCRSYVSEPATAGRLWRSRMGFIMRAYDAFEFEDYTAGTKERVKALTTAALWRPGHEAERRYDTLAQVTMLGHVTEAGMCSTCGGQRSKPRCACPSLPVDVEVTIEESVSAAGARVRRAVPIEEGASL